LARAPARLVGQIDARSGRYRPAEGCRARLFQEVGALDRRGIAPGHDWHARDRVLRAAIDELVRIDEIDQHVARRVAAARDAHLLEPDRAALVEHLLALADLALEVDRPDLPAGERDVRRLLGHAEHAGDAAALGRREIAGDALDI